MIRISRVSWDHYYPVYQYFVFIEVIKALDLYSMPSYFALRKPIVFEHREPSPYITMEERPSKLNLAWCALSRLYEQVIRESEYDYATDMFQQNCLNSSYLFPVEPSLSPPNP